MERFMQQPALGFSKNALQGEEILTSSYNLKTKYIIHTVGPEWNGGNEGEADLLASCYKNSLRISSEN